MLWLGIDPTWHSMGFEHFAVSLLTDPALVEEILERVTLWTAVAASGQCAPGFDFIRAADDIAILGPGYGYLGSSSNSIADCCRAENVVAMVEAVKEFGRYPLGLC
jgi:uroporphyrinogen-III decarboxylase